MRVLMRVLALDTTGPACTVAIVGEGRVLACASVVIGRGHAERLAPMTGEVLQAAGLKVSDLSRIAACTGPGSFTGQRVALAFARALALPFGLPVIGISALEVWAAQSDAEQNKRVAAIADVRRGQLCWAVYDGGQEVSPPQTCRADDIMALIEPFAPDIITGSGAGFLADGEENSEISGPILAWLAMGKSPALFPPEPLYARPPDAKLPKAARGL